MISREIYELEREKIFRRSWLMVGRVEEIPDPGDYFVKEIAVADASIIVLRGADGKIRAFHNVCRHRGSRILEGGGNTKFLACPFHGWVYDTAGSLRAVTEERLFPCLDKSGNGLVPVHLDIWVGKIFVNLQARPAATLAEFLGGMKTHLDSYPFDRLELVASYSQVIEGNWKLAMHNTQEIYHLDSLHSRTIPGGFTVIEKVRLYGPHQIGSCGGDPEYRPTGSEALAHRLGKTAAEAGPALTRGVQNAAPEGLNLDGVRHFTFDFATIFPNHIMTMGNGWVFSYHYWPLGPERTLLEIKRHYLRPQSYGEMIGREFALVVMREADGEDSRSIEATQAGLRSGAIGSIHLGDQEILCRHLHRTAEEWVNAG